MDNSNRMPDLERPPALVGLYQTKLLGICRTSFYFSIYLIIYLVFLFTGAMVFSILETPMENQVKSRIDQVLQKFLMDHPNVTDRELNTLLDEVIKATSQGVSPVRNTSGESNWSFGQSLFFSSTVITTIGYGHVTPLTQSGKIFCMLYAMVGIPLTLVLLSALVERLLIPTVWLLQWLHSRMGNFYPPFKIRLFHLVIIVAISLGMFILVPAAIFASIEPDWDFLDSFYYCFISLTTIGLGDYIPGDAPNQPYRSLYKIATTVYLFLGMTFLMLTLAVFYDIPQLNLGLLFTNNEDAFYSEKISLSPSGSAASSSANLRKKYYGSIADFYNGTDSFVKVQPNKDGIKEEVHRKTFQLP